MRKAVRNNFISHSRSKKRKQLWKRIVSAMAVVVVFCTVYALVLPAITLSGDPVCGKAVHAHTDDCYRTAYQVLECAAAEHQHDGCEDEWGNLTCGYGKVLLHTHNALCRDASGALICKLEERQEHFHSEDCFQKNALLLCEQEECPSHSHDDGCYETARELACELAEQEGHTHGTDCKETEQQLICEEDHEHTDDCYETVETLVCTLEEIEGHTHGEQCYQENQTLTCAQEEVQGHTHTEQCYQITETLTCTEDEVGPHTHSEACDDENGDRICGVTTAVVHVHDTNCFHTVELEGPELLCTIPEHTHEDACFEKQDGLPADQYEYLCGFGEHTHSGDCYDDDEALICNLPEHIHDAACHGTDYSGTANKETPADWEKLMEQVELTGEWRKDLLAIALTQVGYQESKSNVTEGPDGTFRGYTRYGQWAEDPYGCWEAMFVAFCMEYAGVQGVPTDFACDVWVDALSEASVQLYSDFDADAVQPGDLVFLDRNDDGVADYIAIAAQIIIPTEETAVSVKLLGGEVSDRVDYLTLEMTDPQLLGYVDLTAAQTRYLESYSLERIYTDDEVTVTVSFRPTAGIPEEAVLVVKKIDSEAQPQVYDDHYQQAAELLGENATANIRNFQLYDISFRVGDQEINPQENVKVDIRYAADEAVTQDSSISIIHYAEDGLEKPTDVISQVDEEGNVEVNFTTDSFSVYAVVAAADEVIGPFDVLFDGTLGYSTYNGSSNKKYEGAERREDQTDEYGYITLPTSLTSVGNYPYKINGWYDIVNRVYYGPEMLGQTIKVTANTVFYPDYMVADYDVGQPTDTVTDQPDVRDFITTHLFDYNELFNTHSASYTGDLSDLMSTQDWALDDTLPDSLGFVFSDWIDDGNIGRPNDLGDINTDNTGGTRGDHTNFAGTVTSGIMNDDRMAALFTRNDDFIGRHYVGEGDWLYSYDEDTGFYYYNSALNAAAYNKTAERFYVYNYVENVDNSNSLNDYLPLNYGQTSYAEKDNEINYWLGMTSEIRFYLPEASGSSKNVSAKGTDMQFRFSGDDDVWVFVDGQLVLDLGGVHDIVYGEINFADGTYTVAQTGATNTAEENNGMPGTVYGGTNVTTSDLPMVLAGGQEHTLTVYYLERGSSLSNCAIYFNIAPQYELEFVKRDADGIKPLEGAVFEVFDDPECTQHSSLYHLDETTGSMIAQSVFTTDENGRIVCYGLMSGKDYYIKETVSPEGYPDMSEYVIRLNFSETGDPSAVIVSSNGEEWMFTDAYRFDDLGHRIILNVYNHKYIGGEKELYVEKVWADGNENHTADEVVIRLYANGEYTERTITLNAANDWNGEFLLLPEEDENGNPYIYTVQEDSKTGYRITYEEIDEEQSTETVVGSWVETTTLTDDTTYLLVNDANALSATDSGLEWVNAQLAMEKSPSDLDASQWTASSRSNGFDFLSDTSRYLNFNYSSWNSSNRYINTSASAGSYPINYNSSNGGIYARYSSYRSYYITSLNSSTGRAAVSTTSSDAMEFTLYQWQEQTIVNTGHVSGWRVTNTPAEEVLSVTVNKSWADNVPEEDRLPISVTLYSGKEGEDGTVTEVLQVAEATLSTDNGWTYTFEQLAPLSDGYHYYLVENTQDFEISYGNAATAVLPHDSDNVTAARVEFPDEETLTVSMDITNRSFTVNIPVEKVWNSAVPEDLIQDIFVSLYAYDEATGVSTKVQTVTLTEANGWLGEFVDIPVLDDGTFYYIREDTQGYLVEYGTSTSVVIDGVPTTVGLVEYDTDGEPAELLVSNSVQYELPNTGGMGITPYTIGGALLLAAAGFILLYNQNPKRRREERTSP